MSFSLAADGNWMAGIRQSGFAKRGNTIRYLVGPRRGQAARGGVKSQYLTFKNLGVRRQFFFLVPKVSEALWEFHFCSETMFHPQKTVEEIYFLKGNGALRVLASISTNTCNGKVAATGTLKSGSGQLGGLATILDS